MEDNIVFGETTLTDLLQHIYDTTVSKRNQINTMVLKLVQLSQTPEEASILFPIIRNFLDTSVKNDQHIIQIAQLHQKIQSIQNKAATNGGLLSEEDKTTLLNLLNRDFHTIDEESNEISETIEQLTKDIPDKP